MKLVLCLAEVEVNPALDTFRSESDPLVEYLGNAHNLWCACNQHIEVTGEGVLKRGDLIKLLHQLVGIGSLFDIYCDFQSRLVRFISDIVDFTE